MTKNYKGYIIKDSFNMEDDDHYVFKGGYSPHFFIAGFPSEDEAVKWIDSKTPEDIKQDDILTEERLKNYKPMPYRKPNLLTKTKT